MRSRIVTKVYLRDTNLDLVNYWKQYFHAFPDVDISHGDIFEMKADAIVSPSNSFGDMSGGVDLLYRDKFGVKVEALVKKNIKLHFYGELPIGSALSVPLRHSNFRYLISAPTMRVPMTVDNTLHPYYAFQAALLIAKDKDLKSIICPGLATGNGKACLEMVARQMLIAYIRIIHNIMPAELPAITKQMIWMLRCSRDTKPRIV